MVLALLVIGIVYAAPIVVDSFDVGEQALWVSATKTSDSDYVEHGDILGGERDTFLTYSSGTGARINLDIDFGGTSNRLAYTAGDTMEGTAEIQWDDDDNGAPSLNYALNQDLSGDDGFLVEVIFDDLEGKITMEAHTDATHWSNMTIDLPGGLDDPTNRMDLFFDQGSFTQQGTDGPVNWSDVDAIVLKLDGTVDPALDVTIDSVESTSVREYGDLPSSYGTDILSANHIPKGLRLGNNVDTEASYPTTGDADADDTTDFDDEDGVRPTPGVNWQPGTNGGSIDVTVEGCSGTCYLNGWINWNSTGTDSDSDFDDPGEQILTNYPISNGADQTIPFDIPAGTDTTDTFFYARFRICETSGACDNVDNTDTNVNNGEVEDYKWSFGPTGVVLSELKAHPASYGGWALTPAAIILLGLAAMGFLAVARRRV